MLFFHSTGHLALIGLLRCFFLLCSESFILFPAINTLFISLLIEISLVLVESCRGVKSLRLIGTYSDKWISLFCQAETSVKEKRYMLVYIYNYVSDFILTGNTFWNHCTILFLLLNTWTNHLLIFRIINSVKFIRSRFGITTDNALALVVSFYIIGGGGSRTEFKVTPNIEA